VAELPFIDTHVHLFDLRDPNLFYLWLQPGWEHPLLGDIGAIQAQRYWADDFVAETRFANATKSIHVQAALGIDDPVEETRWLQAFAERLGHPHGIVAEVHLAQPAAADVIERHLEYSNMRGVRDFGEGDYPSDATWRAGFAHLEKYELVACLDSSPETFGSIRSLAEAFPNITISLDHAGFPRQRDDEYFGMWKRELVSLAEAPNVVIKISGLGMRDPQWTVDSLRPWVMTCIEAFGGFSHDEQIALFSGNAERIFRI